MTMAGTLGARVRPRSPIALDPDPWFAATGAAPTADDPRRATA
jgi:hypothetical protein